MKSTKTAKLPTPIEEALKTASETVENVASETKVVAAKVEQKVKKAAASARKKGQEIAKDPKAFSVKLGHDIQKKAGEVREGVTKETKRIADEVSSRINKAIEGTIEKGLHRFNVPTRQELRNLTKKVDELGKKIDALKKGRAAAPRATATRATRTRTAK